MQEIIPLNLAGRIAIYELLPDKTEKLLLEKKNTIQAIGLEVICRRMLGEANSAINQIKVYENATLLATGTITQFNFIGTGMTAAKFGVVFDAASFTGHFNRLKLEVPGISATFSEVTGLDFTKGSVSIVIYWTIALS